MLYTYTQIFLLCFKNFNAMQSDFLPIFMDGCFFISFSLFIMHRCSRRDFSMILVVHASMREVYVHDNDTHKEILDELNDANSPQMAE